MLHFCSVVKCFMQLLTFCSDITKNRIKKQKKWKVLKKHKSVKKTKNEKKSKTSCNDIHVRTYFSKFPRIFEQKCIHFLFTKVLN